MSKLEQGLKKTAGSLINSIFNTKGNSRATVNQENSGHSRVVSASLQPPRAFGLSTQQQGLALRENKKGNITCQVIINEKDLGLQRGSNINNKRVEKMVRKENTQAVIQSHKFGSQSKFSKSFLTKTSLKFVISGDLAEFPQNLKQIE